MLVGILYWYTLIEIASFLRSSHLCDFEHKFFIMNFHCFMLLLNFISSKWTIAEKLETVGLMIWDF